MNTHNKAVALPTPTIKRYPSYLRLIKTKLAEGEVFISSAVIAQELGLDHVLTRKDLSMAGIQGTPRRGYPAKELADAIERALGWDYKTKAALIGVGSLGHALLGYKGFQEHSLSIAAAFDSNPALIGTKFNGIDIYDLKDLTKVVHENQIEIGILTVPNFAAQTCADALVAAGIKGIWNFTNVALTLPEEIVIGQVDLARTLAVLSHRIHHQG